MIEQPTTAQECALLEIRDLRVVYTGGASPKTVLDGVSLSLRAGVVTALVGESGSGKSTLALAIPRLLPASSAVSGSIRLCSAAGGNDGVELLELPERKLQAVRGGRIALIFQSPGAALNPVMRVGAQIAEAARLHKSLSRSAARARVAELLADVELEPDIARAYPHELSGGMQQRVMIAIALAGQPQLLLADEPTSALDVIVQAQILALLLRLQRRTGLGVLLITHDMAVAAQVADDIVVMAHGRIVEHGARAAVLSHPRHAATRALVAAARELNATPSECKG